jgi:hypothetical protein
MSVVKFGNNVSAIVPQNARKQRETSAEAGTLGEEGTSQALSSLPGSIGGITQFADRPSKEALPVVRTREPGVGETADSTA